MVPFAGFKKNFKTKFKDTQKTLFQNLREKQQARPVRYSAWLMVSAWRVVEGRESCFLNQRSRSRLAHQCKSENSRVGGIFREKERYRDRHRNRDTEKETQRQREYPEFQHMQA